MRVVVARTLPGAGLDRLTGRFDVEIGGLPFERDWLDEHAPGAAAIVADPTVPVQGDLLDRAGDALKVVANFAVGFDNIDIEAVRARGLRATNTPGVLTNATAELAVALMQAAGRRIVETDQIFRRGEWVGWVPEQFLGRERRGATVGRSSPRCPTPCSSRTSARRRGPCATLCADNVIAVLSGDEPPTPVV